MNERTAAVVAVIVAGVATLATVPAGGMPMGEGSELGADISVFLQSSAADVRSSVDTGMWIAGFHRADAFQRKQLVSRRAATLETRAERLEAERSELLNHTDSEITVQERAKAARLTARIENLKQAISSTQKTVSVAGVNSPELQQLRSRASTLHGQQVAAVARGQPQKSESINVSDVSKGEGDNRGRNSSQAETGTPRQGGTGSKEA